jgi:tRNA1(Val) A37 N6-methylase TrmN6
MAALETENWTEDRLLNGRLTVRQARDGYRAGMDAALLAAACDAKAGQRVIEAGCGPGAALLAAAARRQDVSFTGVERDPEALALAHHNITLNRMSNRVDALAADVAQPFSRLNLKVFDAAIANPPFFDDASALRGPAPARRGAWIADDGLAAWTGFLLKAVREGGTITVIHRADRLGELLALLGDKAGSFQVRAIHPFADTPAKRVLIRAIKTGKAPLAILPPLILHERGGAKHSAEAEAILRGEAGLHWS